MVLICCLCSIHAIQAAPLKVALEQSEDHEVYLAFESALRNSLESHQEVQILSSADASQAELIVAIGAKAAGRFSRSSIPVVNVMVTQAVLEKNKRAGNRRSSGIYMDQPTERQFSLLLAALPQARSIGVMISHETPELASLRKLVLTRGRELQTQTVSAPDQLAPRLSALLTDADVLLVLPDAAIYRSNTIRNILLATYRQHVPMIGLSQNYVRAGALCAVYSTPLQIANQAARMLAQFAKSGKLPDYQYPEEFEVAVNTQVARSLGLTIKSAEQLRAEIGRRP